MPPEANPRSSPWENGFVRRHPRLPFSVPITLHHLKAGIARTFAGMSLDLSEGGFGVLVNGQLSEGETVEVDLPIAQNLAHLIAIVRYSSTARSGLEFLGLTPEERSEISTATAAIKPRGNGNLARLME
jgi:PilZ domain